MNYTEDIDKLVGAYCNKGNSDNKDTVGFVLTYMQQDKVYYISNLKVIASYLKRAEIDIVKYIQPTGLKLYTILHKGSTLYGFIITHKLKERLQLNFENYLESIKCKKCLSRFTEVQNGTTVCTSCGAING